MYLSTVKLTSISVKVELLFVLVVDPTTLRGSWPLGRVLDTKPDERGLVCSVQHQTKTSDIERPITKLCRIL